MDDFGGIAGAKLTHDSPERPSFFGSDPYDPNNLNRTTNSSSTPIPLNPNNNEYDPKMKEIRLFSRADR